MPTSAPGANSDSLAYAHFRVLRRPDGMPWVLGAGGMGITYKAQDTRLRIEVALKVIHPNRLSEPDARRLLVREARAAARVSHPNVASINYLESGDESSEPVFYAMEFVDGLTLQDWLHEHGPAAPALALGFAEQIARGLDAIHAQHLVHRDLKPANIMMLEFPPDHPRYRDAAASAGHWLKIIDFGVAKGIAGAAALETIAPVTSGFRGTVAYASPEQCTEQADLDGRADLYALGCILWELVVGAPPFAARSQLELMTRHVSFPPPWALLRGAAPAVRPVLERLLAKDRAARPANAGEAAELLAAARWRLESSTEPMPALPTFAALENGDDTVPFLPPPAPSRLRRALPWVLAGAAVLMAAFLALRPAPRANDARKTLAVLPFENASAVADDQFMTDGIHADVLANLSTIRDLRVISRGSVMPYRTRSRDLAQVAGELGVGAVVEGRVQRSGSRLRVHAQLTDVRTRESLWAQTYEREITDVFELQGRIAREIAQALAANLSAEESREIEHRPTDDPKAYEYFLRGRETERRSVASLPRDLQAIAELYSRAVEIDPKFALAYAHLAIAHTDIYWSAVDRSRTRLNLAREAAANAARLEPELPQAHLAAGYCSYRADWDYPAALREFQRAHELRPRDGDILYAEGLALRRLGRWAEAERALREAVGYAPLDSRIVSAFAETILFQRRYAEAEAIYARLASLFPEDFGAFHDVERARFYRTSDIVAYSKAMQTRDAKLEVLESFAVEYMLRAKEYPEIAALMRARAGQVVHEAQIATPVSFYLGWACHFLGEKPEATASFTEAAARLWDMAAVQPRGAFERARVAQAYAMLGRPDDARRLGREALALRPLESDHVSGPDVACDVAIALAWAGDLEPALELIEQALRMPGDMNAAILRVDPRWKPLHGHPRYERLVAHAF